MKTEIPSRRDGSKKEGIRARTVFADVGFLDHFIGNRRSDVCQAFECDLRAFSDGLALLVSLPGYTGFSMMLSCGVA